MINWKQGQTYPIDTSKDFATALNEQIAYEHIHAMICADLSSQYQKMDLQGLKRMERYFSRNEFEDAHCLRHYMVDVMGVMPSMDLSYTSPGMFNNIKDLMDFKHTFLVEQYDRLKRLMELALAEKRFCFVPIAQCLIDKAQKGITKLERAYREYKMVNWNSVYILQHSQELHRKYKRKEWEHQKRGYDSYGRERGG